ncbi:hypothetical protein EPUL_006475, partial [Erysiphe pulchra]
MATEGAVEMADYDKVGLYKGNQPASRWLARLSREMKRVRRDSTPEDFFEAVEILFEDSAANWLDSSARYRRIIDNRENATEEDVIEFKSALQSEFPAKSLVGRDERNLQEDIGSFSQETEEPLSSYYGRAQELLRRSYGRDARTDGSSPLSPIEAVVLSGIVSAFLGGLADDKVRTTVLMRSSDVSKSLRGAYEAAEDVKSTLERLQEVERTREEKKEFELLRSHYAQEWGRPLSAVLADLKRNGQHGGRQVPDVEVQIKQQPRSQDTRRDWRPTVSKQPEIQIFTQKNQAEKTPYSGNSGRDKSGNKPPKDLSRHPIVNGTRKYSKDM